MWLDWIILIVGMLLLIKGADFFVDGASKIAKAMHVPSLIIGLTLVSMGTSAPELSVSLQAALAKSNDLSFGNVVGSNIFNTFLILGCASIFVPLVISDEMKKYDIPIMVLLYGLMLLFGFVITPYKLDLVESIIFILLFVSYIALLMVRAKKAKLDVQEEDDEGISVKNVILSVLIAVAGIFAMIENYYITIGVMVVFVIILLLKFKKTVNESLNKLNILFSIIFAGAGLVAIIGGGTFVVESASNIATSLGMSEALVGLTIVAVGTSLPELVTSVVASIKKENDIAIGNVIGSNIFNIIFILGISSSISNLTIKDKISFGISESLADLLVLLLSGILVFIISRLGKDIKKWQGVIFIVLYIAYITYIVLREFA